MGKDAFRRSLTRWIKNKMSQAYNKWWSWAEQERHQRALLARALNKLIKRKLAMGFQKWYEEALAIASEKYRVGAALKRWRNRMLTGAWNQWMYRAASLARVEAIMTQSLMSWCMRDVVKGFNQWRAVSYYWRLAQTQAEKALRHKVLDTYPVELYSPQAMEMLTAPIEEPMAPDRFSY